MWLDLSAPESIQIPRMRGGGGGAVETTALIILLLTCSLSTGPELLCLPPLPPTAGAKIVFVEGGVAATGELTISFSEVPPSAQEEEEDVKVPGNVLFGGAEDVGVNEIDEGAPEIAC